MAVTVLSRSITTMQLLPDTESHPRQPAKDALAVLWGVRMTFCPARKLSWHAVPQLMPPLELTTIPAAVPFNPTISLTFGPAAAVALGGTLATTTGRAVSMTGCGDGLIIGTGTGGGTAAVPSAIALTALVSAGGFTLAT